MNIKMSKEGGFVRSGGTYLQVSLPSNTNASGEVLDIMKVYAASSIKDMISIVRGQVIVAGDGIIGTKNDMYHAGSMSKIKEDDYLDNMSQDTFDLVTKILAII